ncbi:helix-turn-helix domain-containing protein [Pantoea agglomerans]|uniref:helix-turn-helix domain-containing protein n=1 Tax=Enterobacter agglomerans TaxID=549 RepID=UPI001780F93F|nr:helix-turn-helix domain-containing protein [Pantoea agglomerans]MBD8133862.1 helix-turn-helix domain-containing protein [Pantoea agglomerans]
MGSCAAPSAKGGHNFITSRFLQQCQGLGASEIARRLNIARSTVYKISKEA